tara:strand:- start:761 stop:1264 length:504 start_codon:yes stop_codon:yes gene_type:complete
MFTNKIGCWSTLPYNISKFDAPHFVKDSIFKCPWRDFSDEFSTFSSTIKTVIDGSCYACGDTVFVVGLSYLYRWFSSGRRVKHEAEYKEILCVFVCLAAKVVDDDPELLVKQVYNLLQASRADLLTQEKVCALERSYCEDLTWNLTVDRNTWSDIQQWMLHIAFTVL